MVVDGRPVLNPASMVPGDATIVVTEPRLLRGAVKLGGALDALGVPVEGRVALDLGAAAGGFTSALLERGAARVYAVDVGFGQLLGRLRQDPRVLVLERTNIADLSSALVPELVELVTIDLSYLSLAKALPQLAAVRLAPRAELLALVKPMFELELPRPPLDRAVLATALQRAAEAAEAAGWSIRATRESHIRGAGGTVEFFLHATATATTTATISA